MENQLVRNVHWKHLMMLIVCLVSVIKAQAQSYDFKAENDEGDTIYYSINGDNVTVTFGDQKYNGIIRIPSIVNYNGNTYNVTSIGKNAFYYCRSLESIELPASITKIDEYAFYECESLKSANIPTNVRYIGDNAYVYCKAIEFVESQVEVPFEVADNVFYQETKKTATLYVPKGSKSTYQSTKGWDFENIVEKDKDDNNNGDNNSEISLVVWAKDGSKVAFALSKKPKITFTEADLQIMGQGIDVSYELDNLMRFTYDIVNDETVFKDIQTENVNFNLTGESLLFPELKANSTVSIYSINGTLIFSKIVHEAGEYSFPLSNLNVGVYLVSVNGLTYKIMKK